MSLRRHGVRAGLVLRYACVHRWRKPLHLLGITRAKSLERSLSQDQLLLFCRQCWGFLAEDRLSLPALFHGRSQKWCSAAYCTGLVFSHNKLKLTESSFLKVCIPCAFSRGKTIETCVLFIIAAGYEGAKYISFFIVTPPFPPAELGLRLPFRLALHQDNIPYLRNTEPSTKHHV